MTQLFVKSKTAGYVMTLNANLLLYSQALNNAAWTATGMTLTTGQTDPDSGTEAFTLTATGANATLVQSVALDQSANHTFSFYLKRISGTGAVSLTVNGTDWEAQTITTSWARYDVTALTSGTVSVGIKMATSGDAIHACWGQLEVGEVSDYLTNAGNRYTIAQITDADYPLNTVRGCVFLDGRFFVMTPKGEIYQSALEDATAWDALEFIQSQIDPSPGVYLAKYQNYVMALKDESIEFFYDAANPTGSILAPVQNTASQIGCAHEASVKELAGTVIWLGHTREGVGRGVFSLSGTSPQKISTPQIDKLLTADTLGTVYSWGAAVGSHMLYGLTLVDTEHTLVYDFTTQWWSKFTMLALSGASKVVTAISATGLVSATAHGLADGDIILIAGTNADFNGWHIVMDVSTNSFQIAATGAAFSGTGSAQKYTESYFPISASVRCNKKQYMQHATAGVLYEFSQSAYTDAVGAIAMRVRTPKFDGEDVKYHNIAELEVVGDKVDSVAGVRWSDDDFATYSEFRPVDLMAERSRIRRLGRYARRSFEVLHVGDALVRLEALEIEVK